MSKQRFDSVWEAIENTPQEAANMKVRSALMMAVQEYVTANNLTQAEAAQRLGVTQPRVSDLMRGKIELFSVDTLINMLAAAGQDIEIRLKKAA